MKKKTKTVKMSLTYLKEHAKKLQDMSKETYMPMSAIIRKALDEYFEKIYKK